MSERRGERKKLSLPDTKVIPFVAALMLLARAGNKLARKKLDEIIALLDDINF